MEISANLNTFFKVALSPLECATETKSYVVGVMSDFKKPDFDFSNNSITLLFADARQNHTFTSYQQIADWILFSRTMHPEHMKDASDEYYQAIAKSSYYSCFKLMNKQWLLFEELCDEYEKIEEQTRVALQKIKIVNLL
jgi:hypothetical protein